MIYISRPERALLTAAIWLMAALCLTGCSEKESVFIMRDTFTDERDGKEYMSVTIGGKTWMAENLNYRTGNSWCYMDINNFCDTYGRLYDWNTAVTACPSDWHLPAKQDWDDLINAVGGWNVAGKYLKDTTGWNYYAWTAKDGNGSDDYGFSALPGGARYSRSGEFGFIGNNGRWWTITEDGYTQSYGRFIEMVNYNDDVTDGRDDKKIGYSVRCLSGKPPNPEGLKTIKEIRRKEEEQKRIGEAQKKRKAGKLKEELRAQFEKTASYFTDWRDGQKYRVVTIGGKMWMAENLNYRTSNASWCYDNNNVNCIKYGRLYSWNSAMTACPSGWHLPSRQEWDSLAQVVGGKFRSDNTEDGVVWDGAAERLKARSDWNFNHIDNINGGGTDNYGFSALPGGSYSYDTHCIGGNCFNAIGDIGHWWTATGTESGVYGWRMYFDFNGMVVCRHDIDNGDGYSVRCVADSP
jgi:uncharacterized protein (TIGR02145 family)